MPIFSLHRFAIAKSLAQLFQSVFPISWPTIFWFICSLFVAAYYAGCGLAQAFASDYIAQDDAREYVFWMQRFIDPELFPNDLTAEYFQSITPLGYASLFRLMAGLGITPLVFSKILPICLAIPTTIYSFLLSLRLFPLPFTAFISTLILNQSLWFSTDLASATPRSFIYPLLPAFLYYLLRGSKIAIALIMMLQSLFYPLLIFLYGGILSIHWRKNILFLAAIFGLTTLCMAPYIISASHYGPVVSYQQAWQMGEHWQGGRHHFFDPNPWKFWLIGQHSGILPAVMPPIIWVSIIFPLLQHNSERFRLMRLVKPENIRLIVQIIGVAIALYFAAHLFFLKLFFPTRHTIHLFRVLMSIGAGISLTSILDWLVNFFKYNHLQSNYPNYSKSNFIKTLQQIAILSTITIISIILFFYPNFLKTYPKSEYRIGRHPDLYEFIQQQPKDILIATLSNEADNLPTFTHRPILIGREYALPFHLGYYQQIRQRTLDLINAQYHPNLQPVQAVIKKYGIDLWLLEKDSNQPTYLTQKTWLRSFQPTFNQALNNINNINNLNQISEDNKLENYPALTKIANTCTIWQNQQFWLLKAKCISEQ